MDSTLTFTEWAERHYGSEDLALVDCVASLHEAGGDDFAQLPADTRTKAVQLFVGWIAAQHPERSDVGALGSEFLAALASGEL